MSRPCSSRGRSLEPAPRPKDVVLFLIKTFILLGFITSIALNMVACSDNNNEQESKKESSGDHVWKTQTDALKSAKEMAKKMQESLDQQQEKMNDNN